MEIHGAIYANHINGVNMRGYPPTGVVYTKNGRNRVLKMAFSLEETVAIDRYRGEESPRRFVEIAIENEIKRRQQ